MTDTDGKSLVRRLRSWTTDWNGQPMVPGEPPRDGIHCDIINEAADTIARLERERDEARASYQTVKDALHRAEERCAASEIREAAYLERGDEYLARADAAERERDEANAARSIANNAWRLDFNKVAAARDAAVGRAEAAEARLASPDVGLSTTAEMRDFVSALASARGQMMDRPDEFDTTVVGMVADIDALLVKVRALEEALADMIKMAEPNIYPQPDKPHSAWATLQRARETLAAIRSRKATPDAGAAHEPGLAKSKHGKSPYDRVP